MDSSTDQYLSLANIISLGRHALEGIFNEISNGITITDENSRVIYVNRAFTTITGYPAQDIIGDNPGVLHSGRHDKSFYKRMWDDIHQLGRWQGEIWNRHKDGKIIPELLTITKICNEKQQIFYIGIFSDLSSIALKNKKKLDLALRDPLTKLCNRSLLEDRFNVISSENKRSSTTPEDIKHQTALLYIDVNHFKQLNDTYGHLVGDSILVFIAGCLKSCARGIDTVARIGGDEFVVLLPNVKSNTDVEHYCSRVHKKLNAGKKINDLLLKPAISIGACFFPSDASSYKALMANADKAMYFSKTRQLFLTFYSYLIENQKPDPGSDANYQNTNQTKSN